MSTIVTANLFTAFTYDMSYIVDGSALKEGVEIMQTVKTDDEAGMQAVVCKQKCSCLLTSTC